jgi:multimeric flavodoxin WrbA
VFEDLHNQLLSEKIENNTTTYQNKIYRMLTYLRKKKNILFITTSNRWEKHTEDIPKSTQLAYTLRDMLPENNIKILDVTKLKIYPCEGNVSSKYGNTCGVMKAKIKNDEKNPTGYLRCWASYNNKDDELWKVAKALFESDTVIFFASVRWGQANSFYQKLIERLTWIENRHITLKEENVVKNIDAGMVLIGQNFNGRDVLNTEKQVFKFFGFKVPEDLSFNWQYTSDEDLETLDSYKNSIRTFKKLFELE